MELTLKQRNAIRRQLLCPPPEDGKPHPMAAVLERYANSSNRLGILVADGEGDGSESAKPWLYSPKAQATAENEVMLYGPVVDDSWAWLFAEDEAVVIPSRVKARLAEISGDHIVARQNSPGGDLWAGVAAAQLFDDERKNGRTVEMRVDGMSASASSIITVRGNEIVMGEMAQIMIHAPWVWGIVAGNAEVWRSTGNRIADELDRSTKSLASMYAKRNRAGLTVEKITAMLAEDTYMSAEEAVEQGFADRILEPPAAVEDGQAEDSQANRATPDAWADLIVRAAAERQTRDFFTRGARAHAGR